MKSPEMGMSSPEKNNPWGERINESLANLRNLSFVNNSGIELSTEDLSAWQQITDSLAEQDFANPDKFVGSVKEKLEGAQWHNTDLPRMIIDKIEDVIDIYAWKDKNKK